MTAMTSRGAHAPRSTVTTPNHHHHRLSRRPILGAAALILAGCTGDVAPETEPPLEGPVAQSQQALLQGQHRFGIIGTHDDLDAGTAAKTVVSPHRNELGDIVGVVREPGNDGMFCAWYADWKYSCGTSWDVLDDEIANTPFEAGEGMADTATIVSMASSVAGEVYTWTTDGHAHSGPRDSPAQDPLGSVVDTDGFVDGKHRMVDIVGIAMDDIGRVYTYFSDQEYIEGTVLDLDSAMAGTATAYTVAPNFDPGAIVDVGMFGNGHGGHRLYTWLHDIAHGEGHSSIDNQVDAAASSYMRRRRVPGMSVTISKDGRVVHSKGYGYRDFVNHKRMDPNTRCGIASVSKVFTALAAMRQHELGNIDIYGDEIFQDWGIIGGSNPAYRPQIDRNEQSHSPIVGIASYAHAGTDRIVTWYESGRVSVGTYTDPDAFNAVDPAKDFYLLPAGKKPQDIMAIAYSPALGAVAYYADGTFSRGTIDNLFGIEAPDPDNPYAFTSANDGGSGLDHERLVGVDENEIGQFVWWRSDGQYAIGDYQDPQSVAPWTPYDHVSASPLHKEHIRGIAVSKVNGVTYTYGSSYATTNYVYKGVPWNLSTHSEQVDGAPWYENEFTIPDYASAKIHPGLWHTRITPYHLLTHTSGLGMYLDNGAIANHFGVNLADITVEQAIEFSLHHKKVFNKPGEAHAYSNYGYTLVGEAVSLASGQSLEDYIRALIITPRNLSMTTCYDPVDPHSKYDTVVHGFDDVTEEPIGTMKTICSSDHYPWLASSGWMSTSMDLVKVMLATDRDPTRPDILTPATLDLMETPNGAFGSQAVGWRHSGGSYRHGGDWMTGKASFKKYPADYYDAGAPRMTAAICINGGTGSSNDLAELTDAILEAFISQANIDPTYDLYDEY